MAMALHPTARHWCRTKPISDDQVRNRLRSALRRTGIVILGAGLGLTLMAAPAVALDGPSGQDPPPAQTEAPASSTTILAVARQHVGLPYVRGAATPAGPDWPRVPSHVRA